MGVWERGRRGGETFMSYSKRKYQEICHNSIEACNLGKVVILLSLLKRKFELRSQEAKSIVRL